MKKQKIILKIMKRKFIISIVFCAILSFLALVLLSNYITQTSKYYVYDDPSSIPHNKVGLLLGTAKYTSNGRLNLYYRYRLDAVMDLYQEGKIDFILISGDNSKVGYDEPSDFKTDLINRGISEDKIFLDYAGFSTLDSVLRAQKIFGLNRFTVISQKFHNERAIFLAKNKDISAIGFNAESVAGKYSIKTELREYLARVKAFLDIILNSQPKYLGEKIAIH